MTRLEDIPVQVQSPSTGSLGQGTTAILYEIAGMLEQLIATGKDNAIDLRSLPLAPGEHEQLQTALGTGEVTAEVEALGPTRLRETAVRGVWWVSHYNAHEQLIAEFIEVTEVPQILRTQQDDMREGLGSLNERLAERDISSA